jgi:MoaA/NifB/PqqE/SkfB family radical SAM enzyme
MINIDQIKNIVIEATSYCNLHCPQCARFEMDGFLNKDLTLAHLDYETLAKNIQLDQLSSLESVVFEGDHGDVMMHPQAIDLFKLFNNICHVTAYTNGSLRSEKWWANLATIKNLTVIFSIDGLADTNNIYRINSDFDKIIKNSSAFIEAGGQAEWKFIVFKHNEHQIEQARELSRKMGFKNFKIEHTARNWWQGDSWPVKIDGKYIRDIYPSSKVIYFKKESYIGAIEKIKKNLVTNPEKNCWLTRGMIYVNFMGNIMPCCMTSSKLWQSDIESKMWRSLVKNIEQISLANYKLDDILKSNFYTTILKKSFSGEPFVHPTCINYCG